jgi:hypothetical protein
MKIPSRRSASDVQGSAQSPSPEARAAEPQKPEPSRAWQQSWYSGLGTIFLKPEPSPEARALWL